MQLQIKKEAAEFRTLHGFSNSEPVRLKSMLLKLGILTVFKPLRDDFSGMAIRSEDYEFMFINSNHSLGRQHFSICHELYHLYFDKEFIPHQCNSGTNLGKNKTTEYFADLFASYFLLPEDGIVGLIPEVQLQKDKIGIETILKIEQFFCCSRNALLYRLKELGLITSSTYDNFNYDIKNTAIKYGYPPDLYEAGNKNLVIGDYGTLARQLFEKEKISEGHYSSLMNAIGFDILNNDTSGNT
jgi:Zn-dependent peptidase ImmA (M78 family)